MDASKTRHENFMELFRRFREKNAELPDRGMLKLFGEHLELSDRYLSHIKCGRKDIGHATARTVELKCGVPPGWLDQVHTDLEPRSLTERAFFETAAALFRASSVQAQAVMLDLLKKRLKESA